MSATDPAETIEQRFHRLNEDFQQLQLPNAADLSAQTPAKIVIALSFRPPTNEST